MLISPLAGHAYSQREPPDAHPLSISEATPQGMAPIEAAFTQILGAPGIALSWAQEHVEVASSGDVAWDVGTYTLGYDGPDGRVEDNGKYVVVWKKTDAG